MDIRRITFVAPFAEPHLSIDCWPPFEELNAFYERAALSFLRPYQTAIDAGKIEEATAVRVLAKVWAFACIAKSPTPGFEKFKEADWERWLVLHPEHFEEMRAILGVRRNWDPAGGSDGKQGSAEPRA